MRVFRLPQANTPARCTCFPAIAPHALVLPFPWRHLKGRPFLPPKHAELPRPNKQATSSVPVPVVLESTLQPEHSDLDGF